MEIINRLFSARNSLRALLGVVYGVLVVFRTELGLDEAALNKILGIVAMLIGADTVRPIGEVKSQNTLQSFVSIIAKLLNDVRKTQDPPSPS